MAATASTDETDFVGLPADTEEEAVLPAPPAADYDSGSGPDPYLADHCPRRGNGFGP